MAATLESYLEEFHAFRSFTRGALATLRAPASTVTFLVENGLPEGAPPYLALDRSPGPFRPLDEVWLLRDRADLSGLLVVYSDGNGNPICLEPDSTRMVLLDHEEAFRRRVYVNATLVLFAEFMLASLQQHLHLPGTLDLGTLDPEALEKGSFWALEGLAKGESA